MFQQKSSLQSPHSDHYEKRGFTLVEVLVAVSISVVIAAIVLTYYISFARATLSMTNYANFDLNTGKLMQHFSIDVRGAEAVLWTSASEFQLLKKGVYVTYSYDPLLQTVTRSAPGQPNQVIAKQAASLQFAAYDVTGAPLAIGANLNQINAGTKMMQIIGSYDAVTNAGLPTSAPIISARYVLRNKPTPLP
jgi:prepilin-type N-terminal cleavage/methylation domain-containing protein